MANEPKTDPSKTPVQTIPLAKIHDLPGVPVVKQPDKSYGGLVSSIQASGVKEPVILRQREDGEYQILHGSRRRRASELAKKKEILALVYEMTEKEAVEYAKKRLTAPDLPIPGKLQTAPTQEDKAAPAKDAKETDGKGKAAPTAGDEAKATPKDKPEGKEKPAEPAAKGEKLTTEATGKPEEKKEAAAPAQEDKAKPAAKEKAAAPAAPAGPAATGPSGTAIKQVFDPRLDPPSEKDLTTLPAPQGQEAYFITLHPGYLEKSKYNEFSVDRESENFKELFKAIELAGVKDPVLARPKEGGGLEILSGQRRHLIATELNYPVPVIVQNIDDDDAKIIVADCNLHRDKISHYDLSRALRMKMDGMKRKAGRRKKSDPTAPQLNSDEALAKEMGMSVSKLNKVIRLSEATKEVCDQYDEGNIELSIAYALSFLKPKAQDHVLSLMDLGYKLSTKRIERMKPLEKKGKLTDAAMREILEDKDLIPPKQQAPATPTAGSTPGSTAPGSTTPGTPTAGDQSLPSSPDVGATPGGENAPAPGAAAQGQAAPTSDKAKEDEDDITKGKQERPEHTKIVLTGDRLRYYFPDVNMTPREIEESIYSALEERRQRQERQKARSGPTPKGKSGPVR